MAPWRLVIIASDMMYHLLNGLLSSIVTDGCSVSVTLSFAADLQPAISTWYNNLDSGTESGISEKRWAFDVLVKQSANTTFQ